MYPLKVILVGCNGMTGLEVQRELANLSANIEGTFADIPSVIEGVRLPQDEMRLFIVHVGSPEDLGQLKRLPSVFPGRPLLALVDAGKDASMVLSANRSGASQVVLMPIQQGDFKAALDCITLQYAPPDSTTACRVIAVSSVTGGSGATTIAINLGYEIARQQKLRCVLVELSLQMGVLATYLDREPRYTTADLLYQKQLDSRVVEQALTQIADNFHILPGPHQNIEPMNVTPQDAARLVQLVKQLADILILDVPTTHNDFRREAFGIADHVVLVGEQAVPSIGALRLVRGLVKDIDPQKPQTLVINRYDPKKKGFSSAQLQEVLHAPNLVTIANDYASVDAAMNQGVPLRVQAPHSHALADIGNLAHALLASNTPPPPTKPVRRGLFRRLMQAIGLART